MRRVLALVLGAALVLGGVLLRATDPVLSVVLMAGSALPLLHAVLSGVVGGRFRDR